MNFEKSIFRLSIAVLALLAAFALGMYSTITKNPLYEFLSRLGSDVELAIEETENLLRPVHFLQPARYPGEGVVTNLADSGNTDLILLAGLFENNNELRLIRRNGKILARWKVLFSELFPNPDHLQVPPESDWNIDIHGALVLPDGSVVFVLEYGGLVKLDRCGKVLWTLDKPAHHSVRQTQDGGFWVPGQRYHEEGASSEFPPYSPPFSEDTIMKVSEDGQLELELSVPGLFYVNGLEALLTSTGEKIHPLLEWDQELVHLNSIDELQPGVADEYPAFSSGDLLISLRNLNMLLVLDQASRKIKWWKIGPWIRQHDPRFSGNGKIIMFNNNIHQAAFGRDRMGVTGLDVPRISNILEYDFRTGKHHVLYGSNPEQELLTVIRGKVEPQDNGNLLITEFEGGRVLEVDKSGRVIWEYINRYDKNLVAELTSARLYLKDYFQVTDWACPAGSESIQ